MKKLFFSLVAVTMAATATFAQSTLVATLTHGSDVTMYYGTYALRDAYDAAASGDVINLSGGAFQAVDIAKGIAIRGAGIDGNNPTFIVNGFSVNITENDANRCSMEGIRCNKSVKLYGTFSNPYFLKCQFEYLEYGKDGENANIKNAMFADCKITGWFYHRGTSSTQIINSYVNGFKCDNNSSANMFNCIMIPDINYWGARFDEIFNCQITNTIICKGARNDSGVNFPYSTTAHNCIFVAQSLGVLSNSPASNGCWSVNSYDMIFKAFEGNYSDSQTFELTDEAKNTYLGTDGTEVGLYGGILPYNSTPSYPQITKMNVANKTTADGKLSVEIEVSAAQ